MLLNKYTLDVGWNCIPQRCANMLCCDFLSKPAIRIPKLNQQFTDAVGKRIITQSYDAQLQS